MGIATAIRAYGALTAYLLGLALMGGPHLYALLLWDALARVDAVTHRRRVARWQIFWGHGLYKLVFRMIGVTARYDLPDLARDDRALVVVSNHPSGPLDGFLLIAMLVRLGRFDFRSIMKREIMRIPIIGRSCVETECAFLARGGSKDADLAEISRCGRTARTDRACVIIFPEGTRFRGAKDGSGFSWVLPPKSAGLRALLAAMPDCPVLSVTIAWDREIRNGKDVVDSVPSYVGARVAVEARLIEDIDPGYVEEWLRREWRRKDAALSRTD